MQLEDFKIKHRMTVSQVRKAKQILSGLLQLFEEAKNLGDDISDEISQKILNQMNNKTDEQDNFMISTLEDCLDLNEGQPNHFDNIEYLDMVYLFNQLYIKSTTVEKKQQPQSTTSS